MSNTAQITSLDYAILGLLQPQPLSGYGIRKIFETSALANYSSSPGSIYPALKRLQKIGLVEKIIFKEDGKNKFHCTKQGKKTFREWIVQPLDQKDVNQKTDELFLRFAFMDSVVEKKEIINFLTSFRDFTKIYLEELKEYHRNELNDMPLNGRLAFEYGIESYKTILKWCKTTLLLIKNKKQ